MDGFANTWIVHTAARVVDVTGTGIGVDQIGTSSAGPTGVTSAIIDIGATDYTVTIVAGVAGAAEAPHRIGARSVVMAVVGVENTFVDIVAADSIAIVAEVAGAAEAPGGIGARSVVMAVMTDVRYPAIEQVVFQMIQYIGPNTGVVGN